MKKILILILCLVLLVTGCGCENADLSFEEVFEDVEEQTIIIDFEEESEIEETLETEIQEEETEEEAEIQKEEEKTVYIAVEMSANQEQKEEVIEVVVVEEKEEEDIIEYVEPVYYSSLGNFTATYYGYYDSWGNRTGMGTIGASGNELVNGYSIAMNTSQMSDLGLYYGQEVTITCSSLPQINGVYRIDDCGCAYGVVDIFYWQYSSDYMPSAFMNLGILGIEVCR